MSADKPADAPPSERAMAAAWHGAAFDRELRTTDGREVAIVHRGTWTHGFGPDFRDAMVQFDGRTLVTGSIELHLNTGGWHAHGHHLDPRYDDVILHVVGRHDGRETRRHDGGLVPVVELPALGMEAWTTTGLDWSLVGGEVCAETLCRERPRAVREAIWSLGDRRLAARVARLEADLLSVPPGEVLYREIFDGLGYAANREPMRLVARRLPLSTVEQFKATVRPADGLALVRGLLFGVAGFLPCSPADAAFAGLNPSDVTAMEAFWRSHGGAWHDAHLPQTAWTRARVRPANHPAARLSAGAALLNSTREGLVAALLAPVRAGADPVAPLVAAMTWTTSPGIGTDRVRAIVANAVIPFALALAEQSADPALGEAAAAAWERLPAADANEVTRRAQRQVAGESRLGGLGARGQQGLIHLDQTLCRPRRCFECPIGQLVVNGE